MRLFTMTAIIFLACAVTGCRDLPDGDPPEGQIVNIDFGADHLTKERAVEAMIARLSGAIGNNGINNTVLLIKYGDDQDIRTMTQEVMDGIAPTFNLSVIQSDKTGPGLNLKSTLKRDGNVGFWSIICRRNDKILFKTGVKVDFSKDKQAVVNLGGNGEKPAK